MREGLSICAYNYLLFSLYIKYVMYMFIVDAIEKKRRGVNPPPPLPSYQSNNYQALERDNALTVPRELGLL